MSIKSLFELSTPCYIFDIHEFNKGVIYFRNALRRRFADVGLCYSVKTNSLPYALCAAGSLGCKAEVVSHDEYRLARLCGFAPEDIVYNGPLKSKETFLECIENGGIVNIETKRELDWLDELPNGGVYNIGLRLNINISKVSAEDADGEDDNSRFGFSDETAEFADALEVIYSHKNIKLTGLHIHRTSHSRSPRFYRGSVGYAAGVIRKYKLRLTYLDVGGGYFGIFPNKPTFDDYADSIYEVLKDAGLQNLKILVEPGNALTASAFAFLSEVIDIKQTDARTCFVTTDGSRNDVDPFFHKKDYLKEILYASADRSKMSLQIVAGCTCLEYDRLFELNDAPQLKVGDRILYNNVGAYTMTLSPLFIRLFPKVYLNDGSKYTVIRETWTAEDYTRNKTDIPNNTTINNE